MLKNCQTYFKNLVMFTPPYFCIMFDHFSTLCVKELTLEAPTPQNGQTQLKNSSVAIFQHYV